MSDVTMYGIPNCDQVKKAKNWLGEHQIDVHFHDFKKAGVTPELIQTWLKQVGWEVLINRKGTTWRNLPQQEQAEIDDERSAIQCMVQHPSVIKRPVLVVHHKHSTEILVGFSEAAYTQLDFAK